MADKALSAEDLKNWYRPGYVREVAEANGHSEQAASDLVWDLAKGGQLRCVASSLSRQHRDKLETADGLFEITLKDWPKVTDHARYLFWNDRLEIRTLTGDPWNPLPGNVVVTKLFGIRIDPDSVHKHFPTPAALAAPTIAPPVAEKHAGGAPRKAFWDDLFIEMFRQLWDGPLKPERPADIANAMLDWAASKGHKLGETAVKEPAKKLFNAYKSGVKN